MRLDAPSVGDKAMNVKNPVRVVTLMLDLSPSCPNLRCRSLGADSIWGKQE